ncbi:MAG: hypothetical protein KDB90_10210 [Planctomycetes bacterium]|nr:hypothetical protein [Planctomycetota bacterium]
MRSFVLILLVLLIASPLAGNPIALGDETKKGSPPDTKASDLEIEMVSETVALRLSRVTEPMVRRGGWTGFERELAVARLGVHGTYKFKNHGAARSLEIGFPCCGRVESKSIRVAMGNTKLEAIPPDAESVEAGILDYWMKWKAEFPANTECEMTVEYALVLYGERDAGYIIQTGADWKGNISTASVSLTLGDGFNAGHLREIGPAANLEEKGGEYTWRLKDIEPDGDDDVWFRFSLETWDEKIEHMRSEAKKNWGGRLDLAEALAEPPLSGEEFSELNAEQRDQFLSALEGLLPRSSETENKLAIFDDTPLPEPNPEGGYFGNENDSGLDAIFESAVKLAIRAVRAFPAEKRCRVVLEGMVKIMKASDAEKLYLDCDGESEQVWLGDPGLIYDADEVLSED